MTRGRPVAALEPLTPEQRQRVEANLALIHWTLNRRYGWMRGTDHYDDAAQDAYFGLHRAAQLWDPDIATFSTYAALWIRQAIDRGRGTLLGKDYRRAYHHGDTGERWQPPTSLDAEQTDDGMALVDTIPNRYDVEHDAIAHAVTEELQALGRRHVEGPVDEHLIAAWARPHPPTIPQLQAELAAAGVDTALGTIRSRQRRLRQLMRHHHDELASAS